MAYLRMSDCRYYSLTLSLYVSCIFAAILVKDIGAVFEFVGAFGISFTSFALPGLMYLVMVRKPSARKGLETDKQRRRNTVGSICMICLSLFNILLVIFKQLRATDSEE